MPGDVNGGEMQVNKAKSAAAWPSCTQIGTRWTLAQTPCTNVGCPSMWANAQATTTPVLTPYKS